MSISRGLRLEQPGYRRTLKPPLLRGTLSIILAGHLGVRKREQRVIDFRRANGLHIFIAAAVYFMVIVAGVIMLVRYITA